MKCQIQYLKNIYILQEKPTPSSELSKSDLLKILSYLEGEVQARDVVIATLKCERIKRLLADNKYSLTSDPFAALKRDNFATYVHPSESRVNKYYTNIFIYDLPKKNDL